jgi:hypothetical protein
MVPERPDPGRRLPDQRPPDPLASPIGADSETVGPSDPGRLAEPRPAPMIATPPDPLDRDELAAPAAGPTPEPDRRGPRPDSPPMVAMASCTAPQLRRFIKSRPYVPMHELRRRFGINGSEDDVSSIDLGAHRVYVGLPPREGSLLGELLRGGDIGYELSLDPRTPIVIGLYPMRPVARS